MTKKKSQQLHKNTRYLCLFYCKKHPDRHTNQRKKQREKYVLKSRSDYM